MEIGPGNIPLPIFTKSVDWNPNSDGIKIDMDVELLPFEDNTFDFLYSRHVLEDLQNPDFAFKEMLRVAKNGFVETPSPLIECSKRVDYDNRYQPYYGYIHHRYIIWTEKDTHTLCFLPKYPILEKMNIEIVDNSILKLIKDEYYWNNYYEWDSKNPAKFRIYKHGKNFNIDKEYEEIIKKQ